jgi:hypothetical protein
MVARLYDREKSLTGCADHDGDDAMGTAFPILGTVEVLSLPLLLAPWVKT